MAKRLPAAKRARRPNPRANRNVEDNIIAFSSFEQNTRNRNGNTRTRRDNQRHPENEIFKPKKLELIPRNLAQEEYLDALYDETNSIVFAMGPAGTGKTMLCTQFAIKGLLEGRFKKIIITRPAVSVDESHGYLPGTLIEKLAPWVVPIMDVFKEVYPVSVLEKMMKEEIIEISPLAYMRGRTFKNACVIADEMQNATPSQMKMLLTRIGDESRLFITGDLRQHDRGFECNGMWDFTERLRKTVSNSIEVCEFGPGDVERHPVIEEILRIYDREVE